MLNKRCSVSTRVLQVSCALCMDVFFCQSLSCCQKWPDTLKEINGIPCLDFDREISNDATTTIGYVQKSQASHMGE